MYKLTVYIPAEALEKVKQALFAAGAGQYDNYDHCCWQILGEGQFRPLRGSKPFIGEELRTTTVPEYRVELLCPVALRVEVTAALLASHPYEEPAFDFIRLA